MYLTALCFRLTAAFSLLISQPAKVEAPVAKDYVKEVSNNAASHWNKAVLSTKDAIEEGIEKVKNLRP